MNSIEVGRVKLDGRVALAPMSGITDVPFRRLAHRYGAAMVVCEMVASSDLVNEKPESLKRAAGRGEVAPLVIQLAGRDPKWMAEGARIAEGLGADIVDINMGCPARRVTGGLSGSALRREPDRAVSLVRAAVNAVSVPVTVKMRLGWDDASPNAPELARAAEGEGAAMISVHGRTRQQFYKGRADWRAIARVKAAVSVPVLANGDVDSFEDVAGILAQSGADGLMVGRGAQGRPWFPGAAERFLQTGRREAGPTGAALADLLVEHYEAMLVHYGRELGVRSARKHLGWYVSRAPLAAGPSAWRSRLCQADDPLDVLKALPEFAAEAADGQCAPAARAA